MKTIFDHNTRTELIKRIEALTPHSTRQWGKMNVAQMVEHCIRWEEMVGGEKKGKRIFLGRLFGKFALASMIGNEKPVRQNIPTLKEILVEEEVKTDLDAQKQKWINLLKGYENFSQEHVVHPFFGKITKEQVARLAYKHTDHHLRQFGV